MFKTISTPSLLFLAVTFTSLFVTSVQAKTPLDSNENNIVKQVKLALPQALKDIEQAVNINSGSMNFDGVKQVGLLAKQQLSAIGFDVQWLDGSAFNRAGHILATHQSNNPKAVKILMIGHLDTVFAKNDNFQKFEMLSNTEAAGPGVADMKGGNTIIISAMRALKKLDLLDNVSIKILLTGDEESSGRPLSLSKKAIVDAAIWADIALGFENGDNNINTGMASRRGYTGWTLNVVGKPAHSSQIFNDEVGYGAIYETARILEAFRAELEQEKNLTFNPGMIIGGTNIDFDLAKSSGSAFGKNNVIAQKAKVKGDLRALSNKQLQSVQQTMQNIVKNNLNHTQAELTFEPGYPPMALTQGNLDLLAQYSQVSEDLGYNVVKAANPRKAGAADISFAAEHVDMSLDGLGLLGSGAHTKNEIADLTTLNKNIEKAAILIYRVSKQ
ncbi:M20/M25/M40 family metallo-hydrolase [Colwellia hornerae]|uniref:M20 family metallopeptidase n=1 Tax=Colwellia hornerae TaxID=89402 RepID=A0A5C6Q352_9GAMM|nr:M20/M25/M40 family metallo-hydrolase [Colwellia hornerae]TWX47165.1 M20 family metallopeptidase [Colwellia hornerae]TWX54342.1 M20 family metallopeptidase [Colwellia hornerae]TWX63232.1 M20 family metallopeptidase [Colwellia hornerae]